FRPGGRGPGGAQQGGGGAPGHRGGRHDAPARVGVNARRQYVLALTLVVVGALLVLVSSGRTWATGTAVTGGGSTTTGELHVSGNDAADGLVGLALLALAGVAALAATRGRLRRVVAVGGLLTGLTGGLRWVFRDLRGALDEEARKAAGVSSAHATAVQPTVAAWVCVLGGLLILAGGLMAALRAGRWPEMGTRYERRPTQLDPWAA